MSLRIQPLILHSLEHTTIKLATETFSVDASQIHIEDMEGGGYNRVVGVTVSVGEGIRGKYVVRVPRSVYGGEILPRDVAAVSAVETLIPQPTARVISYDVSSNNVLGHAYMVQTRLPGKPLSRVWNDLTLTQKESVARQVTGLWSHMASVRFHGAGTFTIRDGKPILVEFDIPVDDVDEESTNTKDLPQAAPRQTPHQWMISMCKCWSASQLPYEDANVKMWAAVEAIAHSLHKRGFLPDHETFALHHGDLVPWNILVMVLYNDAVKLTGLIDWDFAHVAPKCMSYPPAWLWKDAYVCPAGDEKYAYVAIGEDGKALKAMWESGTSAEMQRYALSPECIIARRIFSLMRKGTMHRTQFQEAASIIQDWHKEHPQDHVLDIASAFIAKEALVAKEALNAHQQRRY